jgi:Cu(I)/Ag(I) efflux system membrane protein CusA/SilA
MPSTLPGISVTEARLLQAQDPHAAQFPKSRASSAKQTAPKPPPIRTAPDDGDHRRPETPSEWRKVDTWYTSWAPSWLKPALGRIRRITSPLTVGRADGHGPQDSRYVQRLDDAGENRIDMLTTGVRTPVGIKDFRRGYDAD